MPNWRFSLAKSKSRSRLIAALPRTGPVSRTFLPGQDDSARFPKGFGAPIGCWICCSSSRWREGCEIVKSYKSILSGKPELDRKAMYSSGIIQLILKKDMDVSILDKEVWMNWGTERRGEIQITLWDVRWSSLE
jgi:hypothetical protein